MLAFDQPADCMISSIATPFFLVERVVEAAFVLWALKTLTSMPANCKTVFTHYEIVSQDTGL